MHKTVEDDNQNGFNSLSKSVWYMFSGLVNQGSFQKKLSFDESSVDDEPSEADE